MVGLLAVIGMAGFALDLGRVYLAKTRLQNAVDAAALDGALTLFLLAGSTTQASSAANTTFTQNLAGVTPTITFSASEAGPYSAGALNARYAQVQASYDSPTYLTGFFVGDSLAVSAVARAGPLPVGDPCGAPLGICGDSSSGDKDCSDGNGCFGIPGSSGEMTLADAPSGGPGNFGYLRLPDDPGVANTAAAMGGKTQMCFTSTTQTTQPGAATSVRAGTNTRFGIYPSGGSENYTSTDYPPDVITTSPTLYAAYSAQLATGIGLGTGVPKRRTLVVPILDCTGATGAASPVTLLGTACMFLTRSVPESGPTAGNVYAQMIDACLSNGGTPTTTPSSSGAQKIVLFQAGSQS
jgi:hypothetical protein